MKPTRNYPVWLTAFMLLGPFFMISGAAFRNPSLIWTSQIAGAAMVVIALFYLAKKLHEQTDELLALREIVRTKK